MKSVALVLYRVKELRERLEGSAADTNVIADKLGGPYPITGNGSNVVPDKRPASIGLAAELEEIVDQCHVLLGQINMNIGRINEATVDESEPRVSFENRAVGRVEETRSRLGLGAIETSRAY